MRRERQTGQVLVLVAGGMFGILAIAALVLDIGLVWSIQRTERAAADAAALAGAQDLQTCTDDGCTRAVSDADRTRAREHALNNLKERFSATVTSGTCDTNADIVDCRLEGTPYVVTIKTPSPSYVNVDPDRAVQVFVDQPSVQLTIARLLGQSDWNVGITSVAGERFVPSYALLTLRPPDPAGPNDQNRDDVFVTGNGGQLIVRNGDIGTNTWAMTSSALITLDEGFSIWHWDPGPSQWYPPWEGCVYGGSCGAGIPPGEQISAGDGLLQMPTGYPETGPTTPTWPSSDGEDGTTACTDEPTVWPLQSGTTIDSLHVTCYRSGVYEEPFNVQQSDDVAYLEPGVYVFNGGLDVNGYLFGGIGPSGSGVTIVVPNTESFDGTGASGIVLNTTCSAVGGGSACWAEPVNGYESPDGYPISIIVPKLDHQVVQGSAVNCFKSDGVTPAENDGTPCTGTSVLKLGASSGSGAGEAIIRIGGVIWAPTDKVTIGSNWTEQQSFVGRIVTWSVKYHGNAALYEESMPGQGPGFVALDAACSGGDEPCVP